MKLHEIQLLADVHPLSELQLSKEQALDAVEKAKKLPEYKSLVELIPDVTTDRQYANGTFMFSHGGGNPATGGSYKWVISKTGKITYGASVMNSVSSPLLTPNDQVENYRRQFQRIIDVINGDVNKRPPVRTYDQGVDDVSGFEEDTPFVLLNSNVKSLKGAPKVASRIHIGGCHNLTSLEHLPDISDKSATIKIADCSNLESMKHVPEQIGTLRLYNNPKLKSLDGLVEVDSLVVNKCRGITSLAGIGQKYLKRCRIIELDPLVIKSHVLGLMLIEGLDRLSAIDSFMPKDNEKQKWFWLAVAVIEGHPQKDRALEFQELLIKHGLTEYAEL